MIIREAIIEDIPHIQRVRNAVKENVLSDPGRVTDRDCEEFISVRGKGWVCTSEGEIVGFAIADLREDNIWALFLLPALEKKGIGRALHDTMLDWYFRQEKEKVWLGTSPGTRAEKFYRAAGWMETGMHGLHEIKFEMTAARWKQTKEAQLMRTI